MEQLTVTQEQFDALKMRADAAVMALNVVRTTSQRGQMRTLTLTARLQKLNMPMQSENGEPTIGALLLQEVGIINDTLHEMFNLTNQVVEELNALAEHYGLGDTTNQSIANVLKYIKITNPLYAEKTDDEIRKELGL